jgi:hypothetical protein
MDDPKLRRALAKARRAAQALVRGDEILECVEENKDLLIEGAEEGVPPVSKIGAILFRKFGDDVKHLPVRQWIGTLTRALLALEGFEVDESGVRFTDPVFKSGSTYRRVEKDDDDEYDPALEQTFRRMVEGLTTSEQRVLLKVVEAELA